MGAAGGQVVGWEVVGEAGTQGRSIGLEETQALGASSGHRRSG